MNKNVNLKILQNSPGKTNSRSTNYECSISHTKHTNCLNDRRRYTTKQVENSVHQQRYNKISVGKSRKGIFPLTATIRRNFVGVEYDVEKHVASGAAVFYNIITKTESAVIFL